LGLKVQSIDRLQNSDFAGQLEEACGQQQEEKCIAKKHKLEQEVENKSKSNNAVTSMAQTSRSSSFESLWCRGGRSVSQLLVGLATTQSS
jgi:hypothetical protein